MAAQTSYKSPGLSPGTLVYIGDKTHEPVRVSVVDYTPDTIEEVNDLTTDDLQSFLKRDSVDWISVSGIQDTAVVETIGQLCGLHPLTLEDIVNTHHRPKMDEFDDYFFLILKMPRLDPADGSLAMEHVCLVVGNGFLLSFQEAEGDMFSPIRARLRLSKGRIRRYGSDYLAYALLDMVVDHYFGVLEQVGEEIETLQESVLDHPETGTLSDIQKLRHQLVLLRKSIWPLREVLSSLLRGDSAFIDEKLLFYYQDVYDHVIHVADTVETNRDQMSGILDIYMSSVSIKMNEVMKVLTVIATLFIPLTFLAGVYGMNFTYMPELEWRYSYPVFWGTVLICLLLMLIWFRRKKWL
ncbi:MAG: magnesium and cobalt transport protein CorA [Desulfobacteraceae bacterium]|nr:MAG: magnesium and cobalt transport protein CorA [Desulfobacteraceae bacterium]